MKLTCDLYGSPKQDIEVIRRSIEMIFGINMEARESSYKGDYYTYDFPGGKDESIGIRYNLDPLDGLPSELEFPDYPVLIYSNSTHPLEIQGLLAESLKDVRLLRRKEIGLKENR